MSTALRVIFSVIIFVLTILFNYALIDIRFDEIRYLLGTIASSDDIANTFGIVARYELIERRMKFGEEKVETYELEARMQALASDNNERNNAETQPARIVRIPARFVLNGIRYLLGKPIINPQEEDKIFDILEYGYFWERIRKYTEALKIYDEVLATTQLTPDIRAAVMVHKSFCYSMISRYDQSKKLYEQVINEYPNTEAGILSWKLLDFLNSMENERKQVQKQNLSEMEKAKQFYLLMDFRNAIKSYSLFLEEKRSPIIMAEARFYKGRSHEELGESEDALMEYRAVLRIDSSKTWARQANRRMLMLGEFYDQQKSIADEARQKLEWYQDQIFVKNVERYAALVNQQSLKRELAGGVPGRRPVSDTLLSLIDQIGMPEIPASSPATEKNLHLRVSDAPVLSQAEIKELQRKKYLAENPYRRPSALKQAIDEYASELKYIYNKRLRSGIKLSGRMLIEIHIRADGTIEKTLLVQSNMGDVEFEEKIQAQIAGWKFTPVSDSLGVVTVNYPFEFFEEE